VERKILISTESRTPGISGKEDPGVGMEANTIHGGMRLEERIRAEAVFRTKRRF
jgi:hypothetical protein